MSLPFTVYGHVDVDAFYASAAQVRNRFLVGKPVGVLSNQAYFVIAKSLELKQYGVKTGEPLPDAMQKCPQAIFVKRDLVFILRHLEESLIHTVFLADGGQRMHIGMKATAQRGLFDPPEEPARTLAFAKRAINKDVCRFAVRSGATLPLKDWYDDPALGVEAVAPQRTVY